MRMQRRHLQCFAERRDGVWLAFCVELGLGAQGDSFEEAKDRLDAQIQDLSAAEAIALLRQGSPWWLRVRFQLIRAYVLLAAKLGKTPDRKRFKEYLPPDLMTC